MAKVQGAFNVLAPAAAVWPALADIDHWACYVPDGKSKGWGTRFSLWPKPQAAVGAQVVMLNEENLPVQAWEIEEWQPGARFKLVKKEQVYPVLSFSVSFEAVLSAVSESECRVETQIDFSFTEPVLGLILNLVWPLKGDLSKFLDRWEKGVLDALSGAPK
jgi:hypothetical protein